MRVIIEESVPVGASGYKISELSNWQKAELARDLFKFAYGLLAQIEEEPETTAYALITEVISDGAGK